jgi:SAM-dependent methyltransferase
MNDALKPAAERVLDYIPPELYDVLYAWHAGDLPFWVDLARGAGGPVLELGCGTGRVHLPLLRAGVDVDGLDLHPGFLEVLRKKAADAAVTPRVFQGDMRDFTMPRRYALVIVPFRTFLLNLTTEDQLRTLRCCREHLESGGRLVVDLFHPSFEILVAPGGPWTLEKEFAHPQTGRPLAIWSRRTVDRVGQVLHAEMELRETDPDGAPLAVHRQIVDLRWIYKAEMELLLRVAGFNRWEIHGGFAGEPLERDDQQIVAWAWKD